MICYKITNSINNKVYIGITKCSLKKRWNEHKSKAKKGKYYLHRAIRKYGVDKFNIEVLKTFEEESDMYNYEIETIKKLKSNDRLFGYNNSKGGEVSSKGIKMTEETKAKISNYQKHRIRKPHSEETKRKMSEKAKGRDMSKAIEASLINRKGKPSNNTTKVILNDKIIFDSLTLASKEYNISVSSISNNIKGKSKKTKVGIWKYYTLY